MGRGACQVLELQHCESNGVLSHDEAPLNLLSSVPNLMWD